MSQTDQDHVPSTDESKLARSAYHARIVRRYVDGLAPGSCLDVGSGGGQLLDVLQARGWRAHGIDTFAGALDPRIQRTSLDEHVPQQPYDLLTFVHSFEHLPDPNAALENAARLLRKHGQLLIVVPNFSGYWSRAAGPDWDWLNLPEHVYHYTPTSLRELVSSHPFAEISTTTTSAEAPAFAQAWLSRTGYYQTPLGRRQPFRGLAFRLANATRLPGNWIADRAGGGAELVLRARRA